MPSYVFLLRESKKGSARYKSAQQARNAFCLAHFVLHVLESRVIVSLLHCCLQRALRLLKQKKMYERTYDNLQNQQFNLDQTKFATENLKDTATTVEAMKGAAVELKSAFKEIDIDEVEDLYDDMDELLVEANEIQDLMGRQYE
jgi:hypothetical protein